MRKFCPTLILFLISVLFFEVTSQALAAENWEIQRQQAEQEVAQKAEPAFWVSTRGNDAWSGKLAEPNAEKTDGPFRTLEKARDAVRTLPKEGAPKTVVVRGGTYELSQPFVLGAEDCDVRWVGADREFPRLLGGRVLSGFEPVRDAAILEQLPESARGNVVQCDLKKLGITDFGSPADCGVRLYCCDRMMTLARYPNTGNIPISELATEGTTVKMFRGTPNGINEGKFFVEDPRVASWSREKEIWTHGCWYHEWSDQKQKIVSIIPETRQITLEEPWHVFGYKKGMWFYAFNLLCEIDQPGEYFIDREAGLLYFWPPEGFKPENTVLSTLENIVVLESTANVFLTGFTLEAARGTAVRMKQATGCFLGKCILRNTGLAAVEVSGERNTVFGCRLYQLGGMGVSLSGGDRGRLTPGSNAVVNCSIDRFSQIVRTYQPAVKLAGVGNLCLSCRLTNAPHMAIGFSGNDHRMERNEISYVCQEANDAGAVYAGRDWTMRGHVIRNNYFHDMFGLDGKGCRCIYLDDMFSSATIEGNYFRNVHTAVYVSGGRDCKVFNNLFVSCLASIHLASTGITSAWGPPHVEKWLAEFKEKGTICRGIRFNQPPYSERYPELARMMDENPAAPMGTEVRRNLCVFGSWDAPLGRAAWQKRSLTDDVARPCVTFEKNFLYRVLLSSDAMTGDDPVFCDPLFEDVEKKDFRLKPDSPVLKVGFEPIPFEKMGIFKDPMAVN